MVEESSGRESPIKRSQTRASTRTSRATPTTPAQTDREAERHERTDRRTGPTSTYDRVVASDRRSAVQQNLTSSQRTKARRARSRSHHEGYIPQQGVWPSLFSSETSVTKQFEGDVDHWNEKGFGFLRYQGKRIFFSAHGVEPDWKGSRGWAFSRDIPVKFNITQRLVGGVSKHCATNVAPLFQMSEQEDLHSYRETSEILSLNRPKGFAFMIRQCGDALFLHKNDVVPAYETRWDLLEIGSPVYHGVQWDGFSDRWKAASVELYSYEELQSFKNEELQSFKNEDLQEPAYEEPEPEPQPAPQVAAPDSVLAPATCGLPLIEIIKRRKLKAV